jgi:hypothetical protein
MPKPKAKDRRSETLFTGDDEMTKDLTKYVTTRQAAEMLSQSLLDCSAPRRRENQRSETWARLACIRAFIRKVSCEQIQAWATDFQDTTIANAN